MLLDNKNELIDETETIVEKIEDSDNKLKMLKELALSNIDVENKVLMVFI